MEIFKIVGLGIGATVLAVFVKNWRKEIAIQISLITAAIIFFYVMPHLKSIFNMFADVSEKIGMDKGYILLILRVIGVAYVVQFGAELCRDAGETAIASKIELGGKLMIVSMSVPVMYGFLEVIEKVVNFS